MAGIGFELKKIFKERSILSLFKGVAYSAFTVIGPMLIIMLCLMVLNIVMETQSVDYSQKDLLTSLTLYIFIFSLILTSPLSAIISRFIADKIFEEKIDDILAGYYIGLLINTAIGVVFAAWFILLTIDKGDIEPLIMLIAGCLFISLLFVFYNMTFISALKKYKSIAFSFIAGMIITFVLALLLYKIFFWSFLLSVLIGMSTGFMFIAFILFALIKNYYKTNSNNYKEFLSYLWRYKLLFLTNLFYVLGLYIHNFVYWRFPPLAIIVASTLYSAPAYDTASFLAMMTNISTTVIFTVRVEINFHERYQAYCQQVLGGTGKDIIMAKDKMFKTLVREIFYIVQIQTIISIAVFLLLMIFASFLGFGGIIMSIYPALAAGYFLIFIMYCMIVFLYYFDDGIGAFISTLFFFIVTFVAAIISTNLKPNLYGISPFIGAFVGWTIAFYRLKYVEHNINRVVFSKGLIVKKIYKDTLKK